MDKEVRERVFSGEFVSIACGDVIVVRQLRIKKGLTQQQLAELADLEYKYIQRIEGKNPPSIGLLKLLKIASALKTTSSKFLSSFQ